MLATAETESDLHAQQLLMDLDHHHWPRSLQRHRHSWHVVHAAAPEAAKVASEAAAAAAAAATGVAAPTVMRHGRLTLGRLKQNHLVVLLPAAAAARHHLFLFLFLLLGFLTVTASALPATPSPTCLYPATGAPSPSRNRDSAAADRQRVTLLLPTAYTAAAAAAAATSSAASPSHDLFQDTDPKPSKVSDLIKLDTTTTDREEDTGSGVIAAEVVSSSPPPYIPIVTPPPDQDAELAKMGYRMTTFYTCDTVGGMEHCGWHVPVLKADGPTTRTDVRVVLAVVSCLAGIFAWGLL